MLGRIGIAAALICAALTSSRASEELAIPGPALPSLSVETNPDATARAAALERLFESLREAPSPELARGVEQLIWSIWLRAGSDESDRLMALSIKAMNVQDFASARSHLDRIVRLEPGFAEGWNKRATVHYLEGDYARSLADIRRVLAIEPRHFGALSGLGMILERIGEKEPALKAFREALIIHPHMSAVQRRIEALSRDIEGHDL